MHAAPASILVALTLIAAPVFAQQPTASPATPAATAPRPPPPQRATSAPPQPSRSPAARRPRSAEPEPDLLQTATQVLNGVLQPEPEAPPPGRTGPRSESDDNLRAAGLDPARLPGALGPLLRANPAHATQLRPGQLRQLARLARGRMNLDQLRSVSDAFLRAESQDAERENGGPVLSPRELGQVLRRASAGSSPSSLQRLVSAYLTNNASPSR